MPRPGENFPTATRSGPNVGQLSCTGPAPQGCSWPPPCAAPPRPPRFFQPLARPRLRGSEQRRFPHPLPGRCSRARLVTKRPLCCSQEPFPAEGRSPGARDGAPGSVSPVPWPTCGWGRHQSSPTELGLSLGPFLGQVPAPSHPAGGRRAAARRHRGPSLEAPKLPGCAGVSTCVTGIGVAKASRSPGRVSQPPAARAGRCWGTGSQWGSADGFQLQRTRERKIELCKRGGKGKQAGRRRGRGTRWALGGRRNTQSLPGVAPRARLAHRCGRSPAQPLLRASCRPPQPRATGSSAAGQPGFTSCLQTQFSSSPAAGVTLVCVPARRHACTRAAAGRGGRTALWLRAAPCHPAVPSRAVPCQTASPSGAEPRAGSVSTRGFSPAPRQRSPAARRQRPAAVAHPRPL